MIRLLRISLYTLSFFFILFSGCGKDGDDPYILYEGSTGQAGHCSLVSSDGYLYIVGDNNAELLIIKTDLVGDKIWEKTYDIFGSFVGNEGLQILETYDHSFLVTAATSFYYNPGFLMKIDDNGDSLWTYRFSDNDQIYFEATAEMSDHSFLVINQEQNSFGPVLFHPIGKKISSGGKLLKTRIFADTSEYLMNLWNWRMNGNGNLEFTGLKNSAGFLMEIDTSLEIVNQQIIDDSREYFNFSITAGQYISGELKPGATTLLRVAKVAPVNSVIWEKDYDMPSTEWTDLSWIWPIPGGYMTTGLLWFEDWKGYKVRSPFCMQIDENGSQVRLWDDEAELPAFPVGFHYIADDYYLMVGNSYSDNGQEEILVWRLK
jgi:hypothetical protein